MAIFDLKGISIDQSKYLADFLGFVEKNVGWQFLNNLLAPILPSPLMNADEWEDLIRKGGCVYFNYLQQQLKSSNILSFAAYDNPADTTFRHVWLCIDDARPVVMSKGSMWFDDETNCLINASRYKPSLDYVDSDSQPVFILSTENRRYFPFELSCRERRHTPTVKCFSAAPQFYNYKVVDGQRVLQMPWCIRDGDLRLYIYCEEKSDTWFYSSRSTISQAFHHYRYHNWIHFIHSFIHSILYSVRLLLYAPIPSQGPPSGALRWMGVGGVGGECFLWVGGPPPPPPHTPPPPLPPYHNHSHKTKTKQKSISNSQMSYLQRVNYRQAQNHLVKIWEGATEG